MIRLTKIGRCLTTGHPTPQRTRKRATRPGRQQSAPRCPLRVEQLETRVTPSVNPATPFELDANVTTQSATTHDWDQVFADNNVVAPRAEAEPRKRRPSLI
jgi:hypothetical protein